MILQVASFKLTRRRIFLMAPLHHHFELHNWSETKVIVRFWIVAAIFAGAGLRGLLRDLLTTLGLGSTVQLQLAILACTDGIYSWRHGAAASTVA